MLLVIITFIASLLPDTPSLPDLPLALLHQEEASNWESKSFSGTTQYKPLDYQNKPALQAISEGTASGLYKIQTVDLIEYPYLNWSWLIKQGLPPLNEQTKAGDDYAARVYVTIGNPVFIWSTKTLSYVWSSNTSSNKVWDNAYTGARVKMLALRGAQDKTDYWYKESRNVYQDLINSFGDKGSPQANMEAYRYINLIAVMTDTDDSDGYAEAYFGDLVFTQDAGLYDR